MEYSKYQLDVFEYWKKRLGNSAVISVAGSGKTFTLIEGLGLIPSFYSKLVSAFNKDIQVDFEKKGKAKGYRNTTYKSYNAFGWGICFRNIKNIELDSEKTVNILKNRIIDAYSENDIQLYNKIKYPIERLVSLFKSLSIHTMTEAQARYDDIVEYYDIDVPNNKHFYGCLMETFEACINETSIMDFDDQKYMPIHNKWSIPQFDNVFTDEAQDLCQIEYELLSGAAVGGLFCMIGDPDQSIYSFKGCTPDAFDKYAKDMQKLYLSTCYRCPINIVKEAQKIVPRIEWAPGAIDGTIDTIMKDDFHNRVKDGDYVICRTNEHLVRHCLIDIENGKRAKVRGRDFGDKCLYLIDKIVEEHRLGQGEVESLLLTLNEHRLSQYEYLKKINREKTIITLDDKINTIKVLIKDCQTITDLKKKIDNIFINDKSRNTGIDYMSIHKSKGLQAKTVYWLRPDLVPHPRAKTPHAQKEEQRLKYVGTTRSQDSLFYVQKDADER